MFSIIPIPTEPSILLGIDSGLTPVICANVPCNEDFRSQIDELSLYLVNLRILGIVGIKSEFPEIESVASDSFLVSSTGRCSIVKKTSAINNVLFADSLTNLWVDASENYCDDKSVVTANAVVRPLSTSASQCQSCVCFSDSTIGDIRQSVKVVPMQKHVVRLRYRDIIVERRFDDEPSVSGIRRSFFKAFAAKLERTDVVCGIALRSTQTQVDGHKKSRGPPHWLFFVVTGVLVILVAVSVQVF
jgi:hypothetical protein